MIFSRKEGIKMALESYCAACTYLGEKGDSDGKYYCDRKGEYHYATDSKCYSFCEAYSRSNSSRQNMFDYSKGHQGSGCYLTTIMCELLEYPDNNYYLNTLRDFRNNVMKPNPKYIPLLITYDMVGPMIARKLEEDKYGKDIAKLFFNHYISKAVSAIEEEKYSEAINIYKAMTETLAANYGINMNIVDVNKLDYDKRLLGHARVRKLNYNK